MNDESGQPPASDDRDGDQRSRAVVILIILMVTALVCVGSYFFLKNMVAATRRDNCLISGQWCSELERKLHGQ